MTKVARRLSEVTKHLVLPDGVVSSGYPAVAAQCKRMGVIHDDWQQGLGRAVLAKRKNGLYAAGITGVTLSTCRQVGKTFTFGTIIFALAILTPGTLVLWTAHHTATTDETFEALSALARKPKIAPYVEQIRRGNGDQVILFKNGSRIMFGARDRGFGRGVPGVSVVVFDEAQILSQSAVTDMVPAANTVKNPLILYMGTPPEPKNPSEVFKGRRKRALAAKAARDAGEKIVYNGLYVEIGADHGADLDDRAQWRKGNPSYPDRTPEESIMRLREQLEDEASFARDGLGIWDEENAGSRCIPAPRWAATGVTEAPSEGVRSFGIVSNLEGTRIAISGALKHDGGVHLELIEGFSGDIEAGIQSLARWLAARWKDTAMIAISGLAIAAPLVQALTEHGVPMLFIRVLSAPEYLASGSLLEEAIKARTMTHPVAPEDSPLERSVAVTDKKFRGNSGGWAWCATTSDGDETPIESLAVAHWAAKNTRRVPGRQSTGRGRTKGGARGRRQPQR